METGKLLLKWEDFSRDIGDSYHKLRNEKEYSDVTLVCDVGEKIEAHKVILAASSSVFAKIFKENKHPHPLVFLRGLSYETMLLILDFVYYGEVKIEIDQLNSFLVAAEDVKLRGISSIKSEEKPTFSSLSENPYNGNLHERDFRMLSKNTNDQIADNSLKAIEDDTSSQSLDLGEHKPQDGHEYFAIKEVEISREQNGVAKGSRPRQKQDHICWSAAWLEEVDRLGDRVGDWGEQGLGRTYRCRWCDKTGKFGSRGKAALLEHSAAQGHKASAERQKN